MNSFDHGMTTTEKNIGGELSVPTLISPTPPHWFAGGPRRGSSLASYLEIPFKNKRLIICCSLLGILLGWLAILVWPRSYQSVAKLTVKVGRENVSMDPTATTGSPLVALQKSQEGEIASVLEVLNSRRVAEKVVDDLGSDVILSGKLPRSEENSFDPDAGQTEIRKRMLFLKTSCFQWLNHWLLQAGIKDNLSTRETAVRLIRGSLWIESPKKSSVVNIQAKAMSPDMAQAIAKSVTDCFLEEHLKGSHTEGSYRFFQKQSAEVEQQLNELAATRAEFMQDHQVVSIEANQGLLGSQLAGIDRDLAVAFGQLEQATAEIVDLKTKLLATADEIVAAKLQGSDDTWSGMRQKFYELELEEQKLAANFSDKHPRLKRIRIQLDGARDILRELDSERVDESTTPNPIKIGLQEELQRKETLVVGLQSMIKEKQQQRSVLDQQVKELSEQERRLTQIDRDIEITTASLKVLREKLEEARVIEELFNEKFSNIHVFQPATYVERAASPRKGVLGFGFLFLGLMTGLTLSFLREGSSPTLRTADDVEQRLGTHVVASIPRLKRMRAPRLREKNKYRKKCQELMAEILLSQHRPGQKRGRSLGIIGIDVGVGASTLAVNLAVASDIDCHLKTVLVDADSRKRSVSKMFGLNGSPGLVELLSGTASHDECLQKVKEAEIDLIASSADSSDEILCSSAAEIVQALEAYLHSCDLLIVDLPAASQPDQAVSLAQHLDCILVVAESERTKTAATERLLNRLYGSNTKVIGVVLTKTRSYLPWFVRSFVAPQV